MKTATLAIVTALLTFAFTASAAEVEVVITGNDVMQFDKKTFTVKSGDTVKLTLKHVGNLPKQAMGHNLVILKKGNAANSIMATFADMATEMIPAKDKDKVLASTKLLGAKESDTITFTAPEAGSYVYVCTFPGHMALMNGTMVVQ